MFPDAVRKMVNVGVAFGLMFSATEDAAGERHTPVDGLVSQIMAVSGSGVWPKSVVAVS